MPNIGLVKTYKAGADIAARTLVKFSADRTVVAAAAATDLAIGVTTEVDCSSGDEVDVIRTGLVEVIAGGVIARGGLVTADSSGHAVACAPSAGAVARAIGVAEVTAASGDIIEITLGASQVTTPA